MPTPDAYLASFGRYWCSVCRCSFGHFAGCPEEVEEVPEETNEEE